MEVTIIMDKEPSLVGECPKCGTNLDNGGNARCSTCAAEPIMVETYWYDRDEIVVVINDMAEADDIAVIAYLKARWPDRYPLITSDGNLWHETSTGRLVLLDLNMGG